MNDREKMRMCPYCEGTVPATSSMCRFCGSEFEKDPIVMKGAFRAEDHHDPYYEPPYSPRGTALKDSVYIPEHNEMMDEAADQYDSSDENKEKGHIIALMLLSFGALLFTLSILLIFLSDHGRVILEWRSRYWSLYFILSIPMLYYGIKHLRKL